MISRATEQTQIETIESILEKKNSKTIYRKLNQKCVVRPTSELTLQKDYDIAQDKWGNIYKLAFLVTIDSKTQAFQFKINHNIYFTNEKLHELGIYKDTPNCSFCNEHTETLRHLFIDCSIVKMIWNDLQALLNEKLTGEQKLFGLFEKIDDTAFDLLNHITIITKQCVHVSRMVSTKPTCRQVIKKISEVENIEYQIAVRNAKLNLHLRNGRNGTAST